MDLYSHLYEEVDREVAEIFDNLIRVNYQNKNGQQNGRQIKKI